MGDSMVGTVMRRHHLHPSPPLNPFYMDGWGGGGKRVLGKYETLSSGSALSRSMRYAEGWLYGGGGGGDLGDFGGDDDDKGWRGTKGGARGRASLFGTVRGVDPYDAVRRSRMARAKSASPPRRKSILEQGPSPYDLIGEEDLDNPFWVSGGLLPRVGGPPPSRPPRRKTILGNFPSSIHLSQPPPPPPPPEIKSILKKTGVESSPIERGTSGTGWGGATGGGGGGNGGGKRASLSGEAMLRDGERHKSGNQQKTSLVSGFRDYKHKKKKQVQFIVSGENRNKPSEKRSPIVIKKPPPEPPPRIGEVRNEPKQLQLMTTTKSQVEIKNGGLKVEESRLGQGGTLGKNQLQVVRQQVSKPTEQSAQGRHEAGKQSKDVSSPKDEVAGRKGDPRQQDVWIQAERNQKEEEKRKQVSFKQEEIKHHPNSVKRDEQITQVTKGQEEGKREISKTIRSRPTSPAVFSDYQSIPSVRQEPLGHEKEGNEQGEERPESVGRSVGLRPRGPPPPPPPRTVFPFTKSQLDKIRGWGGVPTKILTLEDPPITSPELSSFLPSPGTDEEAPYANSVSISVPSPSSQPPPLPTSTPPHDDEDDIQPPSSPILLPLTSPSPTTTIIIGGLPTPSNNSNPLSNKLISTSVLIGESNNNKVTININGPSNPSDPGIDAFHNKVRIGIGGGSQDESTQNSQPRDDRETEEEEEGNGGLLKTILVVDREDRGLRNALKGEVEMRELVRSQIDPSKAARARLVPHICGRSNGRRSFGGSDDEEDEEEEEDSYMLSSSSDCKSSSSAYDHQEKDKLDDEVEVNMGTMDLDDNGYETIRDPIYEEIGELTEQKPPPLPLSPPPLLILEEIDETIPTKSIFEGATKHDILRYLAGAKMRGIVSGCLEDDLSPLTEMSSRNSHLSNASDSSEDSSLALPPPDISTLLSEKIRKSSAEVERNDSGVGSETSRSRWQHLSTGEDQQHSCEDCDQLVDTHITNSGVMYAPLVCRKCSKRRTERREIITEIVETEEKYGRDLRILLEEFYRPMLVAGLLSPEQLSAIFLNSEELLEHNCILAEKLRDALEIAIEQGDEDLTTVNIGALFLEASPMLHAFESYCTRQGAASLLLANLEKEKELLRIFLRVSQMENSVLRRMNLNSFLMVPVQRVTKYPLLLSRLYKVTPPQIVGKEAIKEALQKIELHLEHINYLTKDISATKLWRRISVMNGRRSSTENDMITIKLRKIAVDVLEWNHDEVRFSVEGRLLCTQLTDNNWRRRGTIKLAPVNAILVTLGKPNENYQPDSEEELYFPRQNGIKEASLILIREKGGRYSLAREPLFLDRCIICTEADMEDYFEIQEVPAKETYIFKAEDGESTKRWFRQLQYHVQGLGAWRKRRNAFANIMMNGMQLRT